MPFTTTYGAKNSVNQVVMSFTRRYSLRTRGHSIYLSIDLLRQPVVKSKGTIVQELYQEPKPARADAARAADCPAIPIDDTHRQTQQVDLASICR